MKQTKCEVISTHVPKEVVDAIDSIAKSMYVSRSWVMRRIIMGEMKAPALAAPKKGGRK